jgi:hypothetical protein
LGACQAYSPGTHARKEEDGLDSCHVTLLGLLPCNRLVTRPLDYIKEARVPSRTSTIPPGNNTKRRARYTTPNRT